MFQKWRCVGLQKAIIRRQCIKKNQITIKQLQNNFPDNLKNCSLGLTIAIQLKCA